MTTAQNHADQLSFRKWLVHKLAVTRWGASKDVILPELAVKLGVQLDVLREAVKIREARALEIGHGRTKGRAADYADLKIFAPPEVFRYWEQYCQTLQIAKSAFLRSLVHQFLIAGAPRPTTTTSAWIFRGNVYRQRLADRQTIRAIVTRGVQIALDHYADEWHVKPSAILRGLVLDALEGKTKRLKIVAFSELWGDPDRYLHPERFSTP